MPTLGEVTHSAIEQLTAVSDSARLDAELLITQVLDIPRSRFISQPEQTLDTKQLEKIRQLIQRRVNGEPIAYILGKKHFWDLELTVTSDVLIPRPDTELLVETVLSLFDTDKAVNVLDLGTGSGAITIAIARSRSHWRVTATDDSPAALAVAIENAETYQLHNLSLLQSHWFTSLPAEKRFDIIVSNPPYIRENDPHLQKGDVRFEPRRALTAGEDGLDAIRYLIPASKNYLDPDGWLLLEHGYDQGKQVRDLFIQHHYLEVQQRNDLGGHVRVTMGRV